MLLINIVNASNYTKCVSLSDENCEIQSTLITLHPNEYSQEFHYYAILVELDRCVGSCNTLNDLSNKTCISNKTEVLHLSVFNMFTETNESKTLQKIYHDNVNVDLMEEIFIQINGGITINVNVSVKKWCMWKGFCLEFK